MSHVPRRPAWPPEFLGIGLPVGKFQVVLKQAVLGGLLSRRKETSVSTLHERCPAFRACVETGVRFGLLATARLSSPGFSAVSLAGRTEPSKLFRSAGCLLSEHALEERQSPVYTPRLPARRDRFTGWVRLAELLPLVSVRKKNGRRAGGGVDLP